MPRAEYPGQERQHDDPFILDPPSLETILLALGVYGERDDRQRDVAQQYRAQLSYDEVAILIRAGLLDAE